MKVHHPTPILNVSDIRQSFEWFRVSQGIGEE
jgi:hypothetical protein